MPDISPVCPVCGGEVIVKDITRMVKGGDNALVMKVEAGVCHKCGEEIFDYDTLQRIEKARKDLMENKTEQFKKIGNLYAA